METFKLEETLEELEAPDEESASAKQKMKRERELDRMRPGHMAARVEANCRRLGCVLCGFERELDD